MPDPTWHRLCSIDDIPAEGGFYATVGNRAFAVLRDEAGEVRVIDDACPHAGASLSAGFVEDGCVLCGWHHWAFDLKTGACPDNPSIKVRCYPAKVEDGDVLAKV